MLLSSTEPAPSKKLKEKQIWESKKAQSRLKQNRGQGIYYNTFVICISAIKISSASLFLTDYINQRMSYFELGRKND